MGSYRVANISRCRSRPGMSIVAWVLIGIEVAVVIPWAVDVRPDRHYKIPKPLAVDQDHGNVSGPSSPSSINRPIE